MYITVMCYLNCSKMVVNFRLFVLVLFSVGLSKGTYTRGSGGSSSWSDCTDLGSPMRVTNIQITPNPITLPGQAWVTLEGYSNRSTGSSRLILDLERKGSWFNIPLPCIFNIGSCTYPDLCTMVNEMIEEDWAGISSDLGLQIHDIIVGNGKDPSLCPQPPQSVSIDRNRVTLPRLPAVLSFFATGAYHVNIRIIDNSNEREILCFNIDDLHLQREECGGWFCSFGF